MSIDKDLLQQMYQLVVKNSQQALMSAHVWHMNKATWYAIAKLFKDDRLRFYTLDGNTWLLFGLEVRVYPMDDPGAMAGHGILIEVDSGSGWVIVDRDKAQFVLDIV